MRFPFARPRLWGTADVLHFGAQFAPFIDDSVTWRGYSTRLGPNALLIDAA